MTSLCHRTKSAQFHKQACAVTPGGVNSPVRSFKGLDMNPLVVERGQGCEIFDIDGNRYIDFCTSWGALVCGHAHPHVLQAIQKQIIKGTTFGITTTCEEKFARKITTLLPYIEKIRFVSSGTEAAMTAIRLARGYTGKNLILKFEGHYHGHADHLLVKGGSGLIATNFEATSAGVPHDIVKNTITLPFNNIQEIEALFKKENHIAAVILEPIAANMGVVLPKPFFMQRLRELCDEKKVLLIFDEVITGFRLGLKGAHGFLKVTPDLTCFGKIIGGGFPCAAFGGKKEIMGLLAPLGSVYQAGTLSGNPVAMEAGLATFEILEHPDFYKELEEKTSFLCDPIIETIKKKNLNMVLQKAGSMFTLFFGAKQVTDFQRLDLKSFSSFFRFLFDRGIYFSPSQYEANFISSAHTEDHLRYTRETIIEFLHSL